MSQRTDHSFRPTPHPRVVDPHRQPEHGRHRATDGTPVAHLAARLLGDTERMQRAARRAGRVTS